LIGSAQVRATGLFSFCGARDRVGEAREHVTHSGRNGDDGQVARYDLDPKTDSEKKEKKKAQARCVQHRNVPGDPPSLENARYVR
jgi:hypothetical protein